MINEKLRNEIKGEFNHEGELVLEKGKTLSQSILWELQRTYFKNKGIEAWFKVPFYITSNPYIAYNYATIVVRYIQDCVKNNLISRNHPIYILELGTGHGKFSYHFVSTFFKLLRQLKLDYLDCRYVLTDFTDSNLDYWKNHSLWRPLIESNKVDFAIYDLEAADDINLIFSGQSLTPRTCKNPMITIGNYIFDTVRQDAFCAKNGTLYEATTEIVTDKNAFDINNVESFSNIKTRFHKNEITTDYYQDKPAYNKILEYFRENLKDGYFLLPIGALNCIDNLKRISNNKLLIISGDKGNANLESIDGQQQLHIVFHGSFSCMVNFPAIEQYFKLAKGDAKIKSLSNGLKINLFSSMPLDKFIETTMAYDALVDCFGPDDFFFLKRHLLNNTSLDLKSTNLSTIISYLRFSKWDAKFLSGLTDIIINSLPKNVEEKNSLIDALEKIGENFYPLPIGENSFFDIGRIFFALKIYEKAIEYFNKSIAVFGREWSVIFNLAISHFYKSEYNEALILFNEALSIKPWSEETKNWINNINQINELNQMISSNIMEKEKEIIINSLSIAA